jgi:hypothetical protein
MIDIVKKYELVGLVCLPVNDDKSPCNIKSWYKVEIPQSSFTNCFGIGIICGKTSGGLECMDFDNHFKDAKKVLTEYLAVPEVEEIYKKYKLPIESTMNGGYHLLFRCKKNEGNLKLARRLNSENKPEALIETRGEGGYFVSAPTKGYEVIRNDIYSIYEITEIERNILLNSARSFNEYVEVRKNEYEIGDKIGDKFNSDSNSVNDVKIELTNKGWIEVRDGYWRRPGKDKGISATLGKAGSNVFNVFSSSAYPFDSKENGKGYTPFQVLSLLKYNGDFKECARVLSEKYGNKEFTPKQFKQKEIPKDKLDEIFQKTFIDLSREIEKPPIILSIAEQSGTSTIRKRIFTLGNFSAITGKGKSKKTFLLAMLTAPIVKNDELYGKFFATLPKGKERVLWFDTEQGEYDAYRVGKLIQNLSDTTVNFQLYGLRPFNPLERCQIIEYAFTRFNDLGFVVIDGIADLAVGINDEEESTRVGTLLLRWTKDYNCHIANVIHQNKNDNFATGHLGSMIIKKAEMVISVTKDKEKKYRSLVECEAARGVSEFESFVFELNEGIPILPENNLEVEYNDEKVDF